MKPPHSAATCRIVWLAYTYDLQSPGVAAICPTALLVSMMVPAVWGRHWVGVAGEYGLMGMQISAVYGEKLPKTLHTLQTHKSGSCKRFQCSRPTCSPRVHARKTRHQPCFQ